MSDSLLEAANAAHVDRPRSAASRCGRSVGSASSCTAQSRCPAASTATFGDLDVAVPRDAARQVPALFQAAGYEADRRFNAAQGDRRMIFHGPVGKVDVFVGVFEMCHRLDLSPRLTLERDTLTALGPADDQAPGRRGQPEGRRRCRRCCSPSTRSTRGRATISTSRTSGGSSTTTGGCGGPRRERSSLSPSGAPTWPLRREELAGALEDAPKGKRFRVRARIGERKRWYELPDEIK